MLHITLATLDHLSCTNSQCTQYRYALQLLTPASILSKLSGRTEIGLEDVGETDSLFMDAKSSARMLSAMGDSQYIR